MTYSVFIFLYPTIIFASNSFYESALNVFNEENFEKTIRYLEKEIVFNPKSSESYVLLGKSYEGLDDQNNALKYYEIAFTLIPLNLEPVSYTHLTLKTTPYV